MFYQALPREKSEKTLITKAILTDLTDFKQTTKNIVTMENYYRMAYQEEARKNIDLHDRYVETVHKRVDIHKRLIHSINEVHDARMEKDTIREENEYLQEELKDAQREIMWMRDQAFESSKQLISLKKKVEERDAQIVALRTSVERWKDKPFEQRTDCEKELIDKKAELRRAKKRIQILSNESAEEREVQERYEDYTKMKQTMQEAFDKKLKRELVCFKHNEEKICLQCNEEEKKINIAQTYITVEKEPKKSNHYLPMTTEDETTDKNWWEYILDCLCLKGIID